MNAEVNISITVQKCLPTSKRLQLCVTRTSLRTGLKIRVLRKGYASKSPKFLAILRKYLSNDLNKKEFAAQRHVMPQD